MYEFIEDGNHASAFALVLGFGTRHPVREITTLVLNDDGMLLINYQRTVKHQDKLKTNPQQQILDALNQYYSCFLAAMQYKEEKQKETGSSSEG